MNREDNRTRYWMPWFILLICTLICEVGISAIDPIGLDRWGDEIRIDYNGMVSESVLLKRTKKNTYSVTFFLDGEVFRYRRVPPIVFEEIRNGLKNAVQGAGRTALNLACLRVIDIYWVDSSNANEKISFCLERIPEDNQRKLANWYSAVSVLR